MYGAKVNRCDETDCIHNSFNRCGVCKNPIFAVKIEGGKCKSFKDEKSQLRDEAKKAIVDCFGETTDGMLGIILGISEDLINNQIRSITLDKVACRDENDNPTTRVQAFISISRA